MLPPDVVRNLDEWLLVEYETRNKALDAQFRQKRGVLVAQGLAQSGAMVAAMVALAAQELTVRANITYRKFLESADDCGVAVDDSFRSYGRSEIDRRIRHILVPELRDRALNVVGPPLRQRALDHALSDIDMEGERAARRYQAELDSLITRNKTRRDQPQTAASNTFNVSGTVGVIQIGSGNSATSIQNIDNSTVKGLDELLTRLLPELEALPDSALPAPKSELVEIVVASKGELQKPEPNWTLLRSLLSGIAGTIQTVAALQPAYATLKGLLALIGINLG